MKQQNRGRGERGLGVGRVRCTAAGAELSRRQSLLGMGALGQLFVCCCVPLFLSVAVQAQAAPSMPRLAPLPLFASTQLPAAASEPQAVVVSPSGSAIVEPSEATKILNLVRRLYAVPTAQFELGRFGEQGYNGARQCELLAQFLAAQALVRDRLGGCWAQFRYPGVSNADLAAGRVPKALWGAVQVHGKQAELRVLFAKPNQGRCVYFLQRRGSNWRIYRVRTDEAADLREDESDPALRARMMVRYFPQ